MKYVFPNPVVLSLATKAQIARLEVDYRTSRVIVFYESLDDATHVSGARTAEVAISELDAALALPGTTLEEKILRGLAAIGQLPPGGTIEA